MTKYRQLLAMACAMFAMTTSTLIAQESPDNSSLAGVEPIGNPVEMAKHSVEAAVNLNLVYVGKQGGYHLGKSSSGSMIIKGKGGSPIYAACKLKFNASNSTWWTYEILGLGSSKKYLAFQRSGSGGVYQVWLYENGQWYSDWDRATRGSNRCQ